MIIDTFVSEQFSLVENFKVGEWNDQQLKQLEKSHFVNVTANGEITYHPEYDEYYVWDVKYELCLVSTKDKWYAYAVLCEYTRLLDSRN